MDWNLEKLSAIIAQNEEAIHKTTENKIIECANYKRLCALLVSARQQYKESVRFKVVAISEDDLLKLSENVEVDKLFVEEYLDQTSFIIDANINIHVLPISKIPSANEDARAQFTTLSKSGLVVLEICPDGRINSFVRGEVFPQTIFYSAEEYSKFSYELRPIDDIEDILEEYRRALNERYWNSKFFIPKASLNSLRLAMKSNEEEIPFKESHIQLLINAPEDSFRQDLLVFLRNRLDAIV